MARKRPEKTLEEYSDNLKLYRDMGFRDEEATAQLKIGKMYLEKGMYNKALDALDTALQIFEKLDERPTIAEICSLKGEVYTALEHREDAVNAYTDAADIYGEILDRGMQSLMEFRIGALFRDAGRPREALAHCRKAIDADDKSAGAYLLMGDILAAQNKVREADTAYRNALESSRERGPIYLKLGNLYAGSDRAAALRMYDRAAREGDAGIKTGAYLATGRIHRADGDLQEADKAFREALRHSKGKKSEIRGRVLMNIAELHTELGKKDSALENYRKAAELLEVGDALLCRMEAVGICSETGNTEAEIKELLAMADLLEERKNLPETMTTLKRVKELYVQEKKTDRTLKLLDRIIDIAEANGDFETEAGMRSEKERLLFDTGHTRKAKEYYNKMTGFYYGLGQPRRAMCFFREELRVHRENGHEELAAEDELSLARLHLSTGAVEEARTFYTRALKSFRRLKDREKQAGIYIDLGNIARLDSDFHAAEECYDKSLRLYGTPKNRHGMAVSLSLLEKVYEDRAEVIHNSRAEVQKRIAALERKIEEMKKERSSIQRSIREIGKLLEDKQEEESESRRLLAELRERLEAPGAGREDPKKRQVLQGKILKLREKIDSIGEKTLEMHRRTRELEMKKSSAGARLDAVKDELKKENRKSTQLRSEIAVLEKKASSFHGKAYELDQFTATMTKLQTIGHDIYHAISRGQVPSMRLSTRTKANIEFDERTSVFTYGSAMSQRSAKSTDGANMLLRTSYVIDFIADMIKTTMGGKNRSSTLREMYYISEGWGKYAKFGAQDESNRLIEDLEIITRWLRENFRLRPEEDGARVIGNLTIREKNRKGVWKKINCRDDVGDSGYSVPYNVEVEKLEFKDVDADYVMAIETGGMFDRLVENGFDDTSRAILVHIKGQPARSTRRLIKRMNKELNLPVVCFTDGDPWSYRIFASIAYGAIKTAHISNYLATPETEFIGITPSDIITYELPTDKLTPTDVKTLKSELDDPRFKDRRWQDEINLQLKLNKKSEQQALARHGLDFVTDVYLPEKLGELGLM